jgi:uridine kinase
MLEVSYAVQRIRQTRRMTPTRRAVLTAVSGIDASGKGYVADRLGAELEKCGLRTALIHADGWLNLPHVRFSDANPAEHFYEHAFRFDDMFHQLILPLRDRRSVDVESDYTEETATTYRRHRYCFEDIDVILLEAVFLLRWEYREHYDVSVWVDCTYETALERALARRQEGLSAADTIRSYRTIYFPAQELLLRRDLPQAAAYLRLTNDPRLAAAVAA